VLPRGLLVEEVLQIARDAPCEIEAVAGGVSIRNRGTSEVLSGPSLDLLGHLSELVEAGLTAIKVEDAPRGSVYVRGLLVQIDAAAALEERAA
jgi:collagenase-like PrtC family protease